MNARFSEYVTSGAFQLTLTRSQISALSMMVGGEDRYVGPSGALARKGLIEPIEGTREGWPSEWRLTAAGVVTLALLHQAGLTNEGADAALAEVDSLRAELDKARAAAKEADIRATSLHAKLEQAEERIEILEAEKEQRKFRINIVKWRDPLPEKTAAEIIAEIAE